MVHGNADADLFRAIRAGVSGHADAAVRRLDATRRSGSSSRYIRSLQAASSGSAGSRRRRRRAATPRPAKRCSLAARPARRCHEVNGRGGDASVPTCRTPDGSRRRALRQKIVDPTRAVSPPARRPRAGGAARAPATVVVKTRDGREIRGVRRNEDTFSLQMIDASGQLHLLDKTTLASVTVENTSLHPSDYATTLVGCRDHEPRRVPAHAAGTRR